MKGKHLRVSGVAAALVLALMAGLAAAQAPQGTPLGTGFTYQGRLTSEGTPYSGTCDLKFDLWDALTGGSQVGAQTVTGIALTDGYFTVQLDYGAGKFAGDARWLAISVCCPAGSCTYQPLSPRQPLTASPYALYAKGAPWSGLTGVPAASGDASGAYPALTVTGLQGRPMASSAPASGQVLKWNGSQWAPAADEISAATNAWLLTGNAGTTPGTNYLGTSDNQALEIKVNGGRALRLEPTSDAPNLIGGSSSNTVAAGLYGATIAGGGKSGSTCGETGTEPCWNQVSAEYGAIGGGFANTVSGWVGTVAGGQHNGADGNLAAVGGGSRNRASGVVATVGGGAENRALGYAATVSGGESNQASGNYATVPGGSDNRAAGLYSFAAGRFAYAEHDGSFVWADSTDADFSSTNVNQFLVRANYGVKLVRGTSAFSFSNAALQVDQASTGEAAWFYTTNTGNDSVVLKLLKQPALDGSDADFIKGVEWTGSSLETAKFHIDKNGTYVTGSDFAEALPVAGNPAAYGPGDVLVISLDRPGGVEKCSQAYDGRVLGVYSTRPGVLGADKAGVSEVMAGEVPVAVLGIVPVKVSAENGPIQPGDLLTTSWTPGHAMRCQGLERCFGRTLGKALEGLPVGQDAGVIRMLVTLQ